jgi:hypothetical protein
MNNEIKSPRGVSVEELIKSELIDVAQYYNKEYSVIAHDLVVLLRRYHYSANKRIAELEASYRKAIEPAIDWFQSDEHAERPTLEIIAEIVEELQSDRKQLLKLKPVDDLQFIHNANREKCCPHAKEMKHHEAVFVTEEHAITCPTCLMALRQPSPQPEKENREVQP